MTLLSTLLELNPYWQKPAIQTPKKAKESEEMRDWSQLPDDLIAYIVKQITAMDDYVRFGEVCRSWRLVTKNRENCGVNEPWLLLDCDGDDGICRFCSLTTTDIFYLHLPEVQETTECWGSPFGWLITMSVDYEIRLLNPLTRVQIDLPPPPLKYLNLNNTLPSSFSILENAVLSSSPSSSTSLNNCMVIALYKPSYELAFARLGDQTWTSVEGFEWNDSSRVVYFRDRLFTVDYDGNLQVCDVNSLHPNFTNFAQIPTTLMCMHVFYLVEICGELHAIVRIAGELDLEGHDVEREETFEVYKLDICTRNFTKLLNFDDHALLLGPNFCSSCPTTLSEFSGNCIYFVSSLMGNDKGIFIFDYNTKELGLLDSAPELCNLPWVTPCLW
ncbi:hypothetical protein GIB67_024475 [Kingdonia uniflora]|uniref:F-box domain-containing protein n=1 Tax=Kingdonia uniflora TaxID=39325 RepID=A0A7J7MQ20_9MAGN|nr:hypothetical protein GIB67_034744 [Kingdonia uniflora]KAF6157029.1 hypothetical protein GIB67_024475 [Kingdonia uniflora]